MKKRIGVQKGHYFKMARKEYGSNWQENLIRELVQNAYDARATEIKFHFKDGVLTVEDNGHGINESALYQFIKLGGTQKEKGSVGGIGKAKEIILFAWEEWEIRTLTWFVKGSFGSTILYDEKNQLAVQPMKEEQKGTIIKLKVDEKFTTKGLKNIIITYFNKCNLPITATYNDAKLATVGVSQGRLLYPIKDFGDLYEIEDNEVIGGRILVQVRGLFMFEETIASTKDYIFNMSVPKYSCFTANRNQFTSQWNKKFTQMRNDISFDSDTSHVKKEFSMLVTKIPGTTPEGKFGSNNFVVYKTTKDGDSFKTDSYLKEVGIKTLKECLTRITKEYPKGFFISSEKTPNSKFVRRFYTKYLFQYCALWKLCLKLLAECFEHEIDAYGIGVIVSDSAVSSYNKGYILFNPEFIIKPKKTEWKRVVNQMLFLAAERLVEHAGYTRSSTEFRSKVSQLLETFLYDRLRFPEISKIKSIRKDETKVKKNGEE